MDYLAALQSGNEVKTLILHRGDRASIGGSADDTFIIDGLDDKHIKLRSIGDGLHMLAKTPVRIGSEQAFNRILSAGDVAAINEFATLAVLEADCDALPAVPLDKIAELKIGRSSKSDITLKSPQVSSSHALIVNSNGKYFIKDAGSLNGTFLNGRLLSSEFTELNNGAVIFIAGFMLDVQGGVLRFKTARSNEVKFSLELSRILLSDYSNLNNLNKFMFSRSPRLRAAGESAEVEVLQPPASGQKPVISWLQVLLPPFMMVLVMGSMAIFAKTGATMMYTLPMSFISIFMAVINYRGQTKKWRQTQELIYKKYAEHLSEKEEEVTAVETSYLSILSAINPGVLECVNIAKNINRRLWERTYRDADFLSVRLGTGSIKSNVEIKIPKEQLVLEENELLKEAARLKERHNILSGVPVCHNFLDSSITGLVGSRSSVQKTAWEIIMDIAVHHSYEDVRLICVYPEAEKAQWEWIRWLPHAWNPERTRRFMACERENARPMLRELAEMMKVRQRETREDRNDAFPKIPFYFLVLADKNLVECSGESFLPSSAMIGFAALYAYGDIAALPGECQTIIECGSYETERSGVIRDTLNSSEKFFTPDYINLNLMDGLARALAPVRLKASGGGGIPTKVSFLQGLGINRVNDWDLMQIWSSRRSYASLATPIGIKENGDAFNFDIHEKEMGPHGLVAGTSGSGKSEMLTAWLLSMAAHFSPEDVNFLLIEFKGNDLSNILKTLPHVAGVVSNLQDSSSIERSLKSLRGEIKRRMRVFESAADLDTKSIFKYQEYQKTSSKGKDLEPMPYLITVLDEFAELKTQYPEQMDEFNSIARVGRSLGLYMVLTTQAPGGVITPQMEANSRFRICLRTANTGESKEIIGTPDAFFISSPGRAYVKVGDSIYEQVQTFFSKAPYNPESNLGKKSAVSEINLVELDGKRTRPVSHDKTKGASGDILTEGQVLVRYIVDNAEKNNISNARPVWTDALPEYLTLSEACEGFKLAFNLDTHEWREVNSGLKIPVGRIDDPENQRQYAFALDFMSGGHNILYGAPSSGKTTFLQTAILSAALSYTPEQLNFLVMDFGNWGMKIFEKLPHMLMVADAASKEKVQQAEEYIKSQLDLRRRLFASQGVGTLEAYREVSGKKIPAVIVAVDNMAALYNQYPDTMDTLIQVAREGGGLGVYLLLTAGNPGSFMFRIAQYVKSNHALQLTDKSDYRALVGGMGRQEPGHFAGRGFTKGPLEFQTALCVEGDTEGERVKKLREMCEAMSSSWTGKRASLDEAAEREVDAGELSFNSDAMQIGIDIKSQEPVEFKFESMNGCIISGSQNSSAGRMMALIAKTLDLDDTTDLYIYGSENWLEQFSDETKTASDAQSSDAMIGELADVFDSRFDFEERYKRIVLCINDFLKFYEDISEESADILNTIINSGADRNIFIYIACDLKALGRLYMFRESVQPFASCVLKGNAIAVGGSLRAYTAFNEMHQIINDINLDDMANTGCLIHANKLVQLKFAKSGDE